ncbi:coiled-coil domain-containing protein [Virgibacillus salexigens]|uniref:hypothetical protein n=1 Tax=Virgibacillus massiliensis TaxID=1462526 RepID=UPI00137085D8|nr:hypothetical protein [Virgibacillus massiliensis]MYL43962.1 hypothetical protein [Virgibacillus massiliensis]
MFSKDRVKLKRNSSKIYITIVSFITLGLMFFLASGFIFEEKIQVLATPINENIEVSATENIKIYEWIYDEDKQKMRVIIETNNLSDEYNLLEFKAYQRSDGSEINTDILFKDDSRIIIELSKFDKNYTQIALDLIGEKEVSEEENSEEQNEKTGKKNTKTAIIKTMYNDYREIEKSSIAELNEDELLSYLTKIIIRDVEDNIQKAKEDIKNNNEEIKESNKKIGQINAEKVYQTDEEKINSDSDINALETKIKTLNEDNNLIENDIQRMEEKIEKTRIKERENLTE